MDEKEIFEGLTQNILSDMREDIFRYQVLINKETNIYIGLNIEQRKTLYFFTEPELDEGDILLLSIKNQWEKDENINYEDLDFDIFSILIDGGKEEVKKYITKEFDILDDEFEQLFSDLIISREETKDDWLPQGIIANLSIKNMVFSKFIKFKYVKEYVKQKLKTDELKNYENILKNLKYEDLF